MQITTGPNTIEKAVVVTNAWLGWELPKKQESEWLKYAIGPEAYEYTKKPNGKITELQARELINQYENTNKMLSRRQSDASIYTINGD